MLTLTVEELVALTGRTQPAAQIRWLESQKWAYVTGPTDCRKSPPPTSSGGWSSANRLDNPSRPPAASGRSTPKR